jgi:hypothetical protein
MIPAKVKAVGDIIVLYVAIVSGLVGYTDLAIAGVATYLLSPAFTTLREAK